MRPFYYVVLEFHIASFDILVTSNVLYLCLKDSGFRNNKIVFDSEDFENKTEDIVKQRVSHNISSSSDAEPLGKSSKKAILFEDSSDGEEGGNFKVKSQFEGIKGQKVRTKYNNLLCGTSYKTI
jgi:hypothetical protein